jgi:hypothetical protein
VFHKRETPNWPVRTRECVVEGGTPLPETMPKDKSKKKKDKQQ